MFHSGILNKKLILKLIKVCGLRERHNIEAVAALPGVQWLGFIFYEGSKRCVSAIPKNLTLPAHIKKTGVFVNETEAFIRKTIQQNGLAIVQLHGTGHAAEKPELCQNLRRHAIVVKALSIAHKEDLQAAQKYEGCCDYLLFDTKGPAHGGNGTTFNWHVLNHYNGPVPFLLSGGIGPESTEALRNFNHPKWAGIDLNSRFETALAIKNIFLLKSFLKEINTDINPKINLT